MSINELLEIRDEFTKSYGHPAERFVSVGFTDSTTSPRLSVRVNAKYEIGDLPKVFHGLPVDARRTAPAILGVGDPTATPQPDS